MKIYDENWNEILEPDLAGGMLVESVRVVHHEAVKGVEEEGHFETVAEYPNGGKDVRWVVDVAGVAAQAAWDEEEPCYTWRALTVEEPAARDVPTMEERMAAMEGVVMALMMGGDA